MASISEVELVPIVGGGIWVYMAISPLRAALWCNTLCQGLYGYYPAN